MRRAASILASKFIDGRDWLFEYRASSREAKESKVETAPYAAGPSSAAVLRITEKVSGIEWLQ